MGISSISPIDGRYFSKTSDLSLYFSEKALMEYRIFVEANYLLHLTKQNKIGIKNLKKSDIDLLKSLHKISDDDAKVIKDIENIGYKNIPATNHDVKAVEYFIKIKLAETSFKDVLEMVHFALTSEDINNFAYGLMIRDGFNEVMVPKLIEIYDQLYNLAVAYKDTSMLARTHGQPASPTTFGKEMLVFVSRIKEELLVLKSIPVMVKINGATGNFNAHNVVFPNIDWIAFASDFVDGIENIKKKVNDQKPFLKIRLNKVTTQIEPHDSFARIFDSIKRINTILLDFSQDIWRYISDGWIKQRAVEGEIGSSAMPHKVNPIDFENAEGNFGIANTLLSHFSSKLMISRLQRDLSDSTVQRNIGVAFGHTLMAYSSVIKGLSKIKVDVDALTKDLNNTPEVIAEAYQNILRAEGFDKPYELLKEITRGKKATIDDFYEFVNKLDINKEIKNKLLFVTPENYTGLAAKLVEKFDPKII